MDKKILQIVIIVCFTASLLFGVENAAAHLGHSHQSPNFSNAIEQLLERSDRQNWHMGENLQPKNSFTYEICDMRLRIPESPDPCYILTLDFVDVLRGPHGETWIVQGTMEHNEKTVYAIFQISTNTFAITTDGTSIPYADSIDRTLFWIGQYASEFKPKPITVGKSWGNIASHASPDVELIVKNTNSFETNEESFLTYHVGYYLIEQSSIKIADEFPFPVQATVYKPIASHQDIPLEFTFDLISYELNTQENFLFDFTSELPEMNDDFDNKATTVNQSTADLLDEQKEAEPDDIIDFVGEQSLLDLFEQLYEEHFQDSIDPDLVNFTNFIDVLENATGDILINQTVTDSNNNNSTG